MCGQRSRFGQVPDSEREAPGEMLRIIRVVGDGGRARLKEPIVLASDDRYILRDAPSAAKEMHHDGECGQGAGYDERSGGVGRA